MVLALDVDFGDALTAEQVAAAAELLGQALHQGQAQRSSLVGVEVQR